MSVAVDVFAAVTTDKDAEGVMDEVWVLALSLVLMETLKLCSILSHPVQYLPKTY